MTENPECNALRSELLHLAREVFPVAARAGKFPIHQDHCFLRIVYDNLFEQKWQDVLPKGEAAYKQLTNNQLQAAIALGHSIIADAATCTELNQKSLAWRGK